MMVGLVARGVAGPWSMLGLRAVSKLGRRVSVLGRRTSGRPESTLGRLLGRPKSKLGFRVSVLGPPSTLGFRVSMLGRPKSTLGRRASLVDFRAGGSRLGRVGASTLGRRG